MADLRGEIQDVLYDLVVNKTDIMTVDDANAEIINAIQRYSSSKYLRELLTNYGKIINDKVYLKSTPDEYTYLQSDQHVYYSGLFEQAIEFLEMFMKEG